MAAYVYRIPVYIIAGNYTFHPWLVTMANESKGKIFKSRKEFERFIKEKWGRKQ